MQEEIQPTTNGQETNENDERPGATARSASPASPLNPQNAMSGAEANNVDDDKGLKRRLLKPYDESERRKIEDERRRELFGDVVFSYTDGQAVDDGVLVQFLTPQGRDTRHRITTNAFHELNDHYRPAYPNYDEADFMRFYLAELLPIIPEAVRVYEKNIGGGILKTDYDFRVTKQDRDVLWYIPNEIGGVTMMKPEDY